MIRITGKIMGIGTVIIMGAVTGTGTTIGTERSGTGTRSGTVRNWNGNGNGMGS